MDDTTVYVTVADTAMLTNGGSDEMRSTLLLPLLPLSPRIGPMEDRILFCTVESIGPNVGLESNVSSTDWIFCVTASIDFCIMSLIWFSSGSDADADAAVDLSADVELVIVSTVAWNCFIVSSIVLKKSVMEEEVEDGDDDASGEESTTIWETLLCTVLVNGDDGDDGDGGDWILLRRPDSMDEKDVDS